MILFGVVSAALGIMWQVGGDELEGGIEGQIYQIDVLKERVSESLGFVSGGIIYPERALNAMYVLPPIAGITPDNSTLITDRTTVIDVSNNGIGTACISDLIITREGTQQPGPVEYVILRQNYTATHLSYVFNPDDDDCKTVATSSSDKHNIRANSLLYGSLTRVVVVGQAPPESGFDPGVDTTRMSGVPCQLDTDIRFITTAGNVFVTKCTGEFD